MLIDIPNIQIKLENLQGFAGSNVMTSVEQQSQYQETCRKI